MKVNYARIEVRTAYLSSDFGRDYALRVFDLTPDQLEAIVGRYTKGKRKGELRGMLTWQVVTKGGWIKTGGYGDGYVAFPNTRFDHAIADSWTCETIATPRLRNAETPESLCKPDHCYLHACEETIAIAADFDPVYCRIVSLLGMRPEFFSSST